MADGEQGLKEEARRDAVGGYRPRHSVVVEIR